MQTGRKCGSVDINSKIYVAGHTGMVGSAIVRKLRKEGFNNIVLKTHQKLNLINQQSVNNFFEEEKPDHVFLAAAKVGGIKANNTFRGQFLYENLMIQNNIIHAAHKIGVDKLFFLGSACIYPRDASQPIKEEYILSNYLENTNEPYAIAKIAGIKLCENYFLQYGDNFISVMPNNLYGPNDNFDLDTSHVIPALLRKFHEANLNGTKKVEIWGTGKPKREFLHVDDLADACIFLMKNLNADKLYSMGISHINIGSGEEVSIKELAIMIKNIVCYQGDIVFNLEYPDGMPRKLLDVSRLNSMGWNSKIKLDDGLASVYKWYLDTRAEQIL
jgi:GDP-L-fucose synthase